VNVYGPTVTHIITTADQDGCARRTLKYLFGILAGVWIVNYECNC
jgi:hypothetical protein